MERPAAARTVGAERPPASMGLPDTDFRNLTKE